MIRIIGIDPGSRVTGFGVIDFNGSQEIYVDSGCIRVTGDSLAERLKVIFAGVDELLTLHKPDLACAESVFMHRNPGTAIKLGQARGAAISAIGLRDIPLAEYTPAEIKKAIVGRGNADKEQVQYMVTMLLKLTRPPSNDAADALACALFHYRIHRHKVQAELK
ncbi:MAG: crossover junction endodeoxyribonuclease RuvC [Gammaproteobacteria bacterium]|nr:MAG: crossover junction endodeoxyribonuclease RuvC [Gammaproteobacteria bacterium]RLA16018.1 MAG: crossover junction endodeoxyribonuclease RuvC [Gammaproteobacteria bacterium]RLA16416.1 MAG: crossover junction endodeoxyribonuclease RuvC [Gammaproteobacteria bacterium]